jgi:hypothetical protein
MSNMDAKKPKPNRLEFRIGPGWLHGYDPDHQVEYWVGWCGNGSMSHYLLLPFDGPCECWYVFVDEKDFLYRSIHDAEKRLIYGVTKEVKEK